MAKKRRSGKQESQAKKKKKTVNPLKRVVIERPKAAKKKMASQGDKKKPSEGDRKDKMVKLKTSIHKRVRIMAALEDKQISDLVDELLTTSRKLRSS